MQPESLVKLVGSGNTSTVEEEWLRLLESPGLTPLMIQPYSTVLAELAWRGIETFSLSKASLEDVYLELTAEALEA